MDYFCRILKNNPNKIASFYNFYEENLFTFPILLLEFR